MATSVAWLLWYTKSHVLKSRFIYSWRYGKDVRPYFGNSCLYGVKGRLTQVNLNIEGCSGGLRPIKDTEIRLFTAYLLNEFLSPLSNRIQFCRRGRQREWNEGMTQNRRRDGEGCEMKSKHEIIVKKKRETLYCLLLASRHSYHHNYLP
jgi:hypothetical protein